MGGRCCSERKEIQTKAALKLEDVERFCAKARRCDLPEPETEPVGTGSSERHSRTYIVTNKNLQAPSPGLAYRTIKKLDCQVQHECAFAPWGEPVTGQDENDGWLRVGKVFLPFQVGGVQVIVVQSSAPGSDGREPEAVRSEIAPNDSGIPRKLRCQENPATMDGLISEKTPNDSNIPRKLRCQQHPDTIERDTQDIPRSTTLEKLEDLGDRQALDVKAVGLQEDYLVAPASSPTKAVVSEGEPQEENAEVLDSTEPQAQKKKLVRAALKHAATVGDMDVLKSGLKEAGDLGVGASDIKLAWESLAATTRVKQAEKITRDETVVADMRSELEKQEFSAQGSMRRGARKDHFAARMQPGQELETSRVKQDQTSKPRLSI